MSNSPCRDSDLIKRFRARGRGVLSRQLPQEATMFWKMVSQDREHVFCVAVPSGARSERDGTNVTPLLQNKARSKEKPTERAE